VILWTFDVAADRREAFERAYGPSGDWAMLFARSPDYLGTELLPDPEHDRRYVTVDHWTTREAFEEFRRQWKAEYEALDRACAALTTAETPLGAYDA
jgi:heme-degrading monooxygenase HmoA